MLHLGLRKETAFILLCLLVVLTLVEMGFSYAENRRYYQKRDTLTNIYLSLVTLIINLCVKGSTFFLLNFVYGFRLVHISNATIYWITLLILQDFLYWVLHYTGHYCRLFWAIHVTHHSSEFFNISTGFRSTVFEPLYRAFFISRWHCWALAPSIFYTPILLPNCMVTWYIRNTKSIFRRGTVFFL